MRFVFPHSHAFRSGRLLIDDDEKPGPACTVEFGDGVNVIAEWHSDADAIRLDVPDYRTASGTLVTARSWRLAKTRTAFGARHCCPEPPADVLTADGSPG